MHYIRSLTELSQADLLLAGGKGANLGAMIQAGLPVPSGFCVTTAGYQQFAAANRIEAEIQSLVAGIRTDDLAELEATSSAIQRLFETGTLPDDIAGEIRASYRALPVSATAGNPAGKPAVAVRSSATAEDLPDLSFAGQQDTYLNIVGEDALLRAVVRCWASLWTARAIGYRARNHIDQSEVALAVVVQHMVASESSGVLFTANPLTGRRAETVIDATLGLGEALVSGMVEPDHYVVEDGEGAEPVILSRTLGSKALSVRGLEDGGTQVLDENAASLQALPDAQILELARLGRAAERYFGTPQDMEWAWAGGRLYVLQSRAITSLYPLPQPTADHRLEMLFCFGSWQGMMNPISAMGQDTFTGLVAGLGRAFGSRTTLVDQRALLTAGDRLYVNLTDLIRFPAGRTIARIFISAIDPVSAVILEQLLTDPHFAPQDGKISFSRRLKLLRVVAILVKGALSFLLFPTRERERLQQVINRVIEETRARCRQAGSFNELVSAVQEVPIREPQILLPYLLPGIMSGQAPLQILLRLAEAVPGGPVLALELTRGLPHNVTTEMDLKLWSASRVILADPPSASRFQTSDPQELAGAYLAGQLPPVAQQAVSAFMESYGMRGVGEIDIFVPRWKEDPLHIFQVLASYLAIDSADSPEVVFQKGAQKADQAGKDLVAAFRRTPMGWIKARLVGFLANRTRELAGLRETPKFTIIRLLGEVRDALLPAGQQLADQGVLAEPDDIFFLHLWELEKLAAGSLPNALEIVEQRRKSYQREMNRRRVPRMMLSDGTSFYDGPVGSAQPDDSSLTGAPVSAGVVEGVVRVILDPHGARLLPGEILVCPATDPAWTPLFLAAGGLVMEIGGMVTHGSVVAREYGIPAVVGVSQATTRLKTGQRVRVDGSQGRIQILEEAQLTETEPEAAPSSQVMP